MSYDGPYSKITILLGVRNRVGNLTQPDDGAEAREEIYLVTTAFQSMQFSLEREKSDSKSVGYFLFEYLFFTNLTGFPLLCMLPSDGM